jgi:hypothetical protein
MTPVGRSIKKYPLFPKLCLGKPTWKLRFPSEKDKLTKTHQVRRSGSRASWERFPKQSLGNSGNPSPQTRLKAGDVVVLFGAPEDLRNAEGRLLG